MKSSAVNVPAEPFLFVPLVALAAHPPRGGKTRWPWPLVPFPDLGGPVAG